MLFCEPLTLYFNSLALLFPFLTCPLFLFPIPSNYGSTSMPYQHACRSACNDMHLSMPHQHSNQNTLLRSPRFHKMHPAVVLQTPFLVGLHTHPFASHQHLRCRVSSFQRNSVKAKFVRCFLLKTLYSHASWGDFPRCVCFDLLKSSL